MFKEKSKLPALDLHKPQTCGGIQGEPPVRRPVTDKWPGGGLDPNTLSIRAISLYHTLAERPGYRCYSELAQLIEMISSCLPYSKEIKIN